MIRKNFPPKLLSMQSVEDDNPTEVDVREDEEQHTKLQEIVDLLLAAGYFRARIKGLSPFDKIVGGMTWCIEMCTEDIDIDLLFQENLTIGQKIGLTEKIVAVLPRMKCPYRIEPHQIQGLDSIHIFPVIQWLVKRAIETRQEMGDTVRGFSILHFQRGHKQTPEDEEFQNRERSTWNTINELQDLYQPARMYRHPAPHKIKDRAARVQTTLLEYGKKYGLSSESASEKDSEEQNSSSTETKNAEQQRIQALMNDMSQEQEVRLTASAVGSIVGLQSEEIQQIAAEFADKQSELVCQQQDHGPSGVQYHQRMVASLSKQITSKKDTKEQAEKRVAELQSHVDELVNKKRELELKQSKLDAEMKEMDEMETEENKGILQKLRSLVSLNETLRRQEQEFRAHCKDELTRLQNDIQTQKRSNQADSSQDQGCQQLIEKQLLLDKEKLHKMRLVLARKNRDIASYLRKIDEVPSRAELSQYQRRFVELYNQVAAKHKETKQFYTLYNTLDDTRMYLSREVNLLNSILDNFNEAMSSASNKDQFLTQFSQIVEGIRQTKDKVFKKKQEEKMRRDQLHDEYLDLIEKQRLYFKTVKDFKEECRKNELVLTKLKGRE